MNTVLDLKTLKVGTSISNDFVLVKDYSERTYDEGRKSYISGNFVNKGTQFAFKIWDAQLVKVFKENEIAGNIVAIAGSVKEYKGTLEITVQAVNFSPECKDKSLFIKSADVDGLFKEFADFVNSHLSDKAISVMMGIFQKEDLFDSFKTEFAGSKMHDAQIGGLMNHTLKMLRIAETLINNDSRVTNNTLFKDLIYLGVVFHDIGKVKELHGGNYTQNSYVTHIVFGVEMLSRNKEIIVSAFDEDFFYQLLAIVQGHHGEFGDKPRTVCAYIVHLIDMLDSKTTSMLDKYESGTATKSETGVYSAYDNGNYYVFPNENVMGTF